MVLQEDLLEIEESQEFCLNGTQRTLYLNSASYIEYINVLKYLKTNFQKQMISACKVL